MGEFGDTPHNHRALVVDDDQPIRSMIKRILERDEFIVDTARDGFEAIELLKASDYEVVFLDIMLPHIDGFGVLHFLKNARRRRLSEVVVMTAGGTEGIRDEVPVLTKPFDLEQLRAHARQRCGRFGYDQRTESATTYSAASGS